MTSPLLVLEQLGKYVVAWTWQAAIVVLLAWCVVQLDRRNRPALRCRIWSAALVCMLTSGTGRAARSPGHWMFGHT